MDQSYNGSSPENAGSQPPAPASVPFAGNFPAPVGPPVQPAAAVPPPAAPIPALAPQAGNGFAPAQNGYPAPSSGFATSAVPGAPVLPSQTVPLPQPPLQMGSPGLTPSHGAPDREGHPPHARDRDRHRPRRLGPELVAHPGPRAQVLRPAHDDRRPADHPPERLAPADRGLPGADGCRPAEAALRDHHPEAARALRGRARARLRVLGARPGSLPRQHLPSARRDRRSVPAHPVRDQEARRPQHAAEHRQLRDAAARIRRSSPARPARASRPRSRASSTSPTAAGATTS